MLAECAHPLWPPRDEQGLAETYDRLSQEDRVGQLLMYGFPDRLAGRATRRMLERGRLGSFILMAHNASRASDAARLCAGLRQQARDAGLLPLLVAIDQEGGIVQRLRDCLEVPNADIKDEADAAAEGRRLASLLRQAQVNMDLAPVLDLSERDAGNGIGSRSYGTDFRRASKLGAALIGALQAGGIAATAKHFPGHGGTPDDTERGRARDGRSWEEIAGRDLAPFASAVQEGVAAILTSHIFYPAIDPDLPASLSPVVVGGVLRRQLGYEGVVMTDSLNMPAVPLSTGEAAVQALVAGSDIVLVVRGNREQESTLKAVRAAVKEGRISAGRLRESTLRVLRLKARFAAC